VPTSLGPAEIMVVLLVALIVLGPKRLPEAGRQVGRALAEVRRWSNTFRSELRSTLEAEPEPMPPPATPVPPAASSPAAGHDTPKPIDLTDSERRDSGRD
jgi:sec-independent protein translocase protein TatA